MRLLTGPNQLITRTITELSSGNDFSLNALNSLNFGQINIHHCEAAADEASALFMINHISVLAVQECYNHDKFPSNLPLRAHIISSGFDPFVCLIAD